MTFDLSTLGTRFDVILLEPVLEESYPHMVTMGRGEDHEHHPSSWRMLVLRDHLYSCGVGHVKAWTLEGSV